MIPESDATQTNDRMPSLDGVDHIHVFVANRTDAEIWYREVLGFRRVKALESWATHDGPLTIADAGGRIHLALFERHASANHATVALKVSGEALLRWQAHLSTALGERLELIDHDVAWSIYFSDPFDNPYEMTTYDYDWVAQQSRVDNR